MTAVEDELQGLTQAVLDAWDRNHEALTRWDEARLAVQAVLNEQHKRYLTSIGQGPGPDPDGGVELSDEEFQTFLRAARGD